MRAVLHIASSESRLFVLYLPFDQFRPCHAALSAINPLTFSTRQCIQLVLTRR